MSVIASTSVAGGSVGICFLETSVALWVVRGVLSPRGLVGDGFHGLEVEAAGRILSHSVSAHLK